MWGLKCLPPCDVANLGWIIGIDVLEFEVSPPTYGCLAIYLGFEVSPPFMDVWLFSWGLKCLPPLVDVWLFS